VIWEGLLDGLKRLERQAKKRCRILDFCISLLASISYNVIESKRCDVNSIGKHSGGKCDFRCPPLCECPAMRSPFGMRELRSTNPLQSGPAKHT
jgi:hypothetical protein